jgi:hypothetical protein
MARRCQGDSTPAVKGGGTIPRKVGQEVIERQGDTRGLTNGERHREEGIARINSSSGSILLCNRLSLTVLPPVVTTYVLTGSLHIQMLRKKFADLTCAFDTFGTRFSSGATADSSSEACWGSDEGTGQAVLEESATDEDGVAEE